MSKLLNDSAGRFSFHFRLEQLRGIVALFKSMWRLVLYQKLAKSLNIRLNLYLCIKGRISLMRKGKTFLFVYEWRSFNRKFL